MSLLGDVKRRANMKIRKGQIIALTGGEYSDYNLRDHVRALKDFETVDEIKRFMGSADYLAPPEYDKNGEPTSYGSDDRFISWAIRNKLIEPLTDNEVVEWYLGAHGTLEVT